MIVVDMKKFIEIPQLCRKCGIQIYKPSRGSWWLCLLCYRAWDTEYKRKWNKAHPEKVKENLRKAYYYGHRARKKKEHYALILEHKNKPCTDCKQQFHPCAMDFDHVRGDKEFDIGRAATSARTPEKLLMEIAKCDVVCSNCHRVRTYNRRQNSKIELELTCLTNNNPMN